MLHGLSVLLKDWPGGGGNASQYFADREGMVCPAQREFLGQCFAVLRSASPSPPQYFSPVKGEVPGDEAIEVDPPVCVVIWVWQAGAASVVGKKKRRLDIYDHK